MVSLAALTPGQGFRRVDVSAQPPSADRALILGSALFIALLAGSTVPSAPLLAQVSPDTTLPVGGRSTLAPGGNCSAASCIITGGSRVGENLFHSFSSFNVQDGLTANFEHDPGVARVFSRVTGGGSSDINGILRTDGASLFLINPEGIIFGPQAQIDIGKTFVGTSASRVVDSGSGQFSARDFGNDQLFGGPPRVLLFLTATGGIRLRGPQQTSPIPNRPVFNPNPGTTLALLGGSIGISDRTILVPSDQLLLGGFKREGGFAFLNPDLFSLSTAPPDRVEDINITNTSIIADPSNPNASNGEVRIRATDLTINDSLISTFANQPGLRNGSIRFSLQGGELSLNQSQLVAQSTEGSNGGNISVGSLSNTPETSTSLLDTMQLNQSSIRTEAAGAGGRIQFAPVNGNINLIDNSRITTQTQASSSAQAGSLYLGGQELNLAGGSQLQTTTSGIDSSGDVGKITLNFDRDIRLTASSIAALTTPGNSAAAGNIRLEAEDLELFDNSQILTNTPTIGGNLRIDLDDDLIMEQASLIQTQAGQAEGGNLTIFAEDVRATRLTGDNDIIAIGPQDNLSVNVQDVIEQFALMDPPERGNAISEIGHIFISGMPPTPPQIGIGAPPVLPPTRSTEGPVEVPPEPVPFIPQPITTTQAVSTPPVLQFAFVLSNQIAINNDNSSQTEALGGLGRSSQTRPFDAPRCHPRTSTSVATGLSLSGRGGVRPMAGLQRSAQPLVDLGVLDVGSLDSESLDSESLEPGIIDMKIPEQKSDTAEQPLLRDAGPLNPSMQGSRFAFSQLVRNKRLNQEAQTWSRLSNGQVRLWGSGNGSGSGQRVSPSFPSAC